MCPCGITQAKKVEGIKVEVSSSTFIQTAKIDKQKHEALTGMQIEDRHNTLSLTMETRYKLPSRSQYRGF